MTALICWLSVYLYSCSNHIHGVGDGGGCCCCHWSCQSLQNQMGALTRRQQGQLLCEDKRVQDKCTESMQIY